MPSSAAAARLGVLDILRVLNAESGLTLDGLETIVKSREIAIGGAAGEIGAPLPVLLIALRLCAVSERALNKQGRDRY